MRSRYNSNRGRASSPIGKYGPNVVPIAASCLRLIRALAVETHERWLEDNRYLNMEYWREHRRQVLHQAA